MRNVEREHWGLTLLLLATVAACAPQSDRAAAPEETEAAQPEFQRGTVPAGEFQLRYQIEGTGTAAIVIGSSVYLPRAFSQNLRKHLRLVFLDHRGYAPSPGPMDAGEFTVDKMLDDVERARQQLGLGRIAIIGHSIHSVMALEYAKKYPDNVSHVIMIGSAALNAENGHGMVMDQYWEEFASPERRAALEENRRRLPNEQLDRLPPGQRFLRLYIREGPRTWYDTQFDASPLWEGVGYNDDYGRARPFRSVDITQGLDIFDRPVFLALGRYDFRVAPPSSWDPFRTKFRDLTIRVFERSGHWPHYEEEEAFDSALLNWLEERQ
jgi:proline iminopeptidase